MPNFEEHCESTARKLGCRFERIHKWMDSPSGYMGRTHRLRRHDPYKTPDIAKELFSKHYPNHAHLIEEAVLDHIELDRNSSEDFAYSEAEESLKGLDEEEREAARRESIRKEWRLRALRGIPKWLALFIGSIIAFLYFLQSYSLQSGPIHSGLVVLFALTSFVFLWVTLDHIGGYLEIDPIFFTPFTLIEIGVVIFLIFFGVNTLTLLVFGTCTGFYVYLTIGSLVSAKRQKRYIKRLRAETRKIVEERRRLELGEPEPQEEEEPDLLSEENLEAQGTPSSAVMDSEDIEEE